MQIEENVGDPLKSSVTVVLNHSLNLAQKFTVISKKVLIYYVLIQTSLIE